MQKYFRQRKKLEEQLQQTVETNLSQFVAEDNETFKVADFNEFDKPFALSKVLVYVSVVLGIWGNILSSIVCRLRLHVAKKNLSAVYLIAIAINDLAFLLFDFTRNVIPIDGWLIYCVYYLQGSFPAGTPGNGVHKVILTVGTAFPASQERNNPVVIRYTFCAHAAIGLIRNSLFYISSLNCLIM